MRRIPKPAKIKASRPTSCWRTAPLWRRTIYLPTICGVAVVCEGGGDVGVQARITSLLSALLDVPSNRICVEQRG